MPSLPYTYEGLTSLYAVTTSHPAKKKCAGVNTNQSHLGDLLGASLKPQSGSKYLTLLQSLVSQESMLLSMKPIVS